MGHDIFYIMKEIVNAVKKVTDIVGEIAAASKEQSNDFSQKAYGTYCPDFDRRVQCFIGEK